MVLSKEKSIYDYIFSYWSRLIFHLERAADALSFQQSWQAYNIVTSRDKTWLRSMGFRKNSKFPLRLAERARHTLVEWNSFKEIHKEQFKFYKKDSTYLNMFIYKYILSTPE